MPDGSKVKKIYTTFDALSDEVKAAYYGEDAESKNIKPERTKLGQQAVPFIKSGGRKGAREDMNKILSRATRTK